MTVSRSSRPENPWARAASTASSARARTFGDRPRAPSWESTALTTSGAAFAPEGSNRIITIARAVSAPANAEGFRFIEGKYTGGKRKGGGFSLPLSRIFERDCLLGAGVQGVDEAVAVELVVADRAGVGRALLELRLEGAERDARVLLHDDRRHGGSGRGRHAGAGGPGVAAVGGGAAAGAQVEVEHPAGDGDRAPH